MQLLPPFLSQPTEPTPQPTQTQRNILNLIQDETILGDIKDASGLSYPELEKIMYEMRRHQFVDYSFEQRDGGVVMVWYKRVS